MRLFLENAVHLELEKFHIIMKPSWLLQPYPVLDSCNSGVERLLDIICFIPPCAAGLTLALEVPSGLY